MSELFLALSADDQREVLEQARASTGRPTHLLEKDAWVVWTLAALFESPLATDLTFKGGTSLSKAYRIIDRFSEDVDLTCDIRKLIPDLIATAMRDGEEGAMPANRSQAGKWSKAVRDRLPAWLATNVRPVLEAALVRDGLTAQLETAGATGDKLLLRYAAVRRGTGYVSPVITLEFGGRATGEPHGVMPVVCDMHGHVPGVAFPAASPLVMSVARTFWEKATAAHVYCRQGRVRRERFARHWHDLAAIGRSRYLAGAAADRAVADAVAWHKSFFFPEKDSAGLPIDYLPAAAGQLRIVPEGDARDALADDYAHMLSDDLMVGDALPFDELMHACATLEAQVNEAAIWPPV